MATNRAYTAGQLELELDREHAGWLYSFEGGMASSDVVTEKFGPDVLMHKHLSPIKFDDISVSCGAAMSPRFTDWVNKSFSSDYERRGGALIQGNYDMKEMFRVTFQNALVCEVGFPTCDASSKENAKLNIKFTPEYTTILHSPGGGSPIFGPIKPKTQKLWLCRNFDGGIDGFPTGLFRRMSKIEPIVVKQKVVEYPTGELRDAWKEPATVEYPNIVMTIPEVDAAPFFKWYKEFVIDGRCDPAQEKTGHIQYLSEDKQNIANIDLYGLGLFKLTPTKAESQSENIRAVKVEMYCERLTYQITARDDE